MTDNDPTMLTIAEPHTLTEQGAVRIEHLRDLRYGEVLCVHEADGRFTAEIWNSMGLGDCPQSAWDALNADKLAKDQGALLVLLNGPRHWLMDAIENIPRADRQMKKFGEIPTSLVATLDLGTELPDPTPYTERTVLRDTIWEWNSGRTIYELISDAGVRYTMQAYCLAVDTAMNQESLDTLGERLALPSGWRYRARTLDDRYLLRAPNAVATVLQDEYRNTYMRAPDDADTANS